MLVGPSHDFRRGLAISECLELAARQAAPEARERAVGLEGGDIAAGEEGNEHLRRQAADEAAVDLEGLEVPSREELDAAGAL